MISTWPVGEHPDGAGLAALGQNRLMARRVQLSRQRGWRLPATAVSVAAPTKWANPFRPDVRGDRANADAVARYRRHLAAHPDLVAAARRELAGRDLACWCGPQLPCHADVLLELVAEPELTTTVEEQ